LLEPFERRDMAAVGCEQRGFPRGKHRRRDVLVDRVIESLLSFGRGRPSYRSSENELEIQGWLP
jgi:hypothetical protein